MVLITGIIYINILIDLKVMKLLKKLRKATVDNKIYYWLRY